MCEYCETITRDGDGEFVKLPFQSCHTDVTADGIRVDSCLVSTESQIVGQTPISKRRHVDDGLVGELQVLTEFRTDDDGADKMEVMVSIPIKYCPFCGRKF